MTQIANSHIVWVNPRVLQTISTPLLSASDPRSSIYAANNNILHWPTLMKQALSWVVVTSRELDDLSISGHCYQSTIFVIDALTNVSNPKFTALSRSMVSSWLSKKMSGISRWWTRRCCVGSVTKHVMITLGMRTSAVGRNFQYRGEESFLWARSSGEASWRLYCDESEDQGALTIPCSEAWLCDRNNNAKKL